MQHIQLIGTIIHKVDAAIVRGEAQAEEAAGTGRVAGVAEQGGGDLGAVRGDFDEFAVAAVDCEEVAVGGDDEAQLGVEVAVGGEDVQVGVERGLAGQGIGDGNDAIVQGV